MIKVDLITGFLGSGKTTFLKKYAEHLISSGEKVGILENDYGAVNVDVMLLGELEKRGCQLETIAGACDYDCHKRRFKTKLIAMGMSGLTRVIIEPSGIFDIDEFFDILHEEPLNKWYEAGSVVTIIDPTVNIENSEFSRYILSSQAANAGAVVFSKTQLVTKEDISKRTEQINLWLKKFKSEREIKDEIITKPWGELRDSDFEKIKNSGFNLNETAKIPLDNSPYSSLYFMNTGFDRNKAEETARLILSDKACGNVFRIKGFVKEESWYEINATSTQTDIKPIELGQDIIIVIGENLSENNISSYFNNK